MVLFYSSAQLSPCFPLYLKPNVPPQIICVGNTYNCGVLCLHPYFLLLFILKDFLQEDDESWQSAMLSEEWFDVAEH